MRTQVRNGHIKRVIDNDIHSQVLEVEGANVRWVCVCLTDSSALVNSLMRALLRHPALLSLSYNESYHQSAAGSDIPDRKYTEMRVACSHPYLSLLSLQYYLHNMSCRPQEDTGHQASLPCYDYQESEEVFHLWGPGGVFALSQLPTRFHVLVV